MSENMGIWKKVCVTDKEYTEYISQRGGFTAIDCQYHVMRATEIWGPVGQGWSYQVSNERVVEHGNILLFFCDVTLKYDQCQYSFGPIPCVNAVVDDKGRIDDDATKKAVTDGLSKLFSHLGFSADVYLGKFESNKYTSKKQNKPKGKPPVKQPKAKESSQPVENTHLTDSQINTLINHAKTNNVSVDDVFDYCISAFDVAVFNDLRQKHYRLVYDWITQHSPTGSNKNSMRISDKMRKRLFAIAHDNGFSNDDVSAVIKEYGYTSTSDILNSDYDSICFQLNQRKAG